MQHGNTLEYLQQFLFVFTSHLLDTRLRQEDLKMAGFRLEYARHLQDRDSSMEYRVQPQRGQVLYYYCLFFLVVGSYTFLQNDLNLFTSRGWSLILKHIQKFNLNFHISRTFPHHVDISFSEVGASENVIALLHFGRQQYVTVADVICP